MPRRMYDSTNPFDCPADAQLIGYYTDGLYAHSEAEVRSRFPGAVPVGISAIGTDSGVVGDVEPGCMSPGYSVGWARGRRRAGLDPTIYMNSATWGQVRSAFLSAGEPEPHYWVADWRNYPEPVIPAGAVARQYGGSAQTRAHFDISIVADYWPGVDAVTDADLILIHDLLQFAIWGVIDTSAQSRNDFVFAVHNGRSVSSVVDGWRANPQAAKWQASLATLGSTGQPADLQAVLAAIKADETADQALIAGLGNLTGKLDAVAAAIIAKIPTSFRAE